MTYLKISPHPTWNYLVKFCFGMKNAAGEKMLPTKAPELLKQYPGVVYAPTLGKGTWQAPVEAISYLAYCADKLDLRYTNEVPQYTQGTIKPTNMQWAYPHQREAATKAINTGNTLICHEMGLGKTATAIGILNQVDLANKRVLILCPAIAKSVWVYELRLRCPFISRIEPDTGLDTSPIEKGAQIVSYASIGPKFLSKKAPTWDYIIFDEIHYLSNPNSQRTRACVTIRQNNPLAYVLGLTGTPIADNPSNLWQLLEILYPMRYGGYYRFKLRYADKVRNRFARSGISFRGLDIAYADELRDRLARVTHRVTKKEVAHLLPPYTVTWLEIDAPSAQVYKQCTEQEYTAHVIKQSTNRASKAAEWAIDQLQSGNSHVAIMTHLRKTGDKILAKLQRYVGDGTRLTLINGDMSPKDRERAIEQNIKSPKGIVIATMASVGIGINCLAHYSTALFAELAYWPVETQQALARFHRLNSVAPVHIYILSTKDPIDQAIEYSLQEKIKNMNKLLRSGVTEDMLLHETEDPNWQETLAKTIMQFVREVEGEEYY